MRAQKLSKNNSIFFFDLCVSITHELKFCVTILWFCPILGVIETQLMWLKKTFHVQFEFALSRPKLHSEATLAAVRTAVGTDCWNTSRTMEEAQLKGKHKIQSEQTESHPRSHTAFLFFFFLKCEK